MNLPRTMEVHRGHLSTRIQMSGDSTLRVMGRSKAWFNSRRLGRCRCHLSPCFFSLLSTCSCLPLVFSTRRKPGYSSGMMTESQVRKTPSTTRRHPIQPETITWRVYYDPSPSDHHTFCEYLSSSSVVVMHKVVLFLTFLTQFKVHGAITVPLL